MQQEMLQKKQANKEILKISNSGEAEPYREKFCFLIFVIFFLNKILY